MLRKTLKWVGLLLLAVLLLVGGYVAYAATAYGRSMSRVYEVSLPALASSSDPVVLERGRHLAESVAGCATADCHGTDLGGGNTIEAGPVGSFTAPNITSGGLGSQYSDGELARLRAAPVG